MRLGQIALRLRARAIPDFGNRIFGAAEFAAAQEYSIKDETAFIIPLVESDQGDNKFDNSINQMVNERVGIVVALKNDTATTQKLGLGAFDRIWAIRQKLFCILLGWRPPETEMPMYYKGGRLLDMNPAWIWYQFEFQQETHITDSADGINSGPCVIDVFDDFMRVYTQWLIGNASQAILPMTGPPPQLPESLVPADMETAINFTYGFGGGFSPGFDTLAAAVMPRQP